MIYLIRLVNISPPSWSLRNEISVAFKRPCVPWDGKGTFQMHPSLTLCFPDVIITPKRPPCSRSTQVFKDRGDGWPKTTFPQCLSPGTSGKKLMVPETSNWKHVLAERRARLSCVPLSWVWLDSSGFLSVTRKHTSHWQNCTYLLRAATLIKWAAIKKLPWVSPLGLVLVYNCLPIPLIS